MGGMGWVDPLAKQPRRWPPTPTPPLGPRAHLRGGGPRCHSTALAAKGSHSPPPVCAWGLPTLQVTPDWSSVPWPRSGSCERGVDRVSKESGGLVSPSTSAGDGAQLARGQGVWEPGLFGDEIFRSWFSRGASLPGSVAGVGGRWPVWAASGMGPTGLRSCLHSHRYSWVIKSPSPAGVPALLGPPGPLSHFLRL